METKNALRRSEQTFQLKGSLFTLTVMQLTTIDLDELSTSLQKQIEKTPKFFHYMPVVIDLQKLNRSNQEIDFAELIKVLRQYTLVPVGVKAGNTRQHEAALLAGLAIMPTSKNDNKEITTSNAINPNLSTNSKIINTPVRSGQRIYAKNAELIVLGSVSHGAELIADGSIHIYGALRGRALAGAQNNQEAHIFCRELDAELIAIAGNYLVKEDIKFVTDDLTETIHIYLENGKLRIGTL